jgi:hypothetical protein
VVYMVFLALSILPTLMCVCSIKISFVLISIIIVYFPSFYTWRCNCQGLKIEYFLLWMCKK